MESIKCAGASEQAHMFIWRYKDIPQKDVYTLQKDFYTFSKDKHELEEFDVVRLLEHRGNELNQIELRKAVGDMLDKETKTLSFIQLACHVFEKPYRRFLFADVKSRDEAMAEALAEANDPEAARIRFDILQQVEEEAAQKKKDHALIKEAPANLSVVDKARFFKTKMTVDDNKAIEMKVREEAAIRKALKKAKEEEEEAVKNEYRRKLEREALEAERLERGEPEEVASPVVEEEKEEAAVEELEVAAMIDTSVPAMDEENLVMEDNYSDDGIASEAGAAGMSSATKKRKHLSMKGLKKRMLNVVNAVNDHVITPLKNKFRKVDGSFTSPTSATPKGGGECPLSENDL